MENEKNTQHPEPPPVPDYVSSGDPGERSFPLWILKIPDGRSLMHLGHEYRGWKAKVEAWKCEVAEIGAAVKAARESELTAGRSPYTENPPAGPVLAETERRVADSIGCPSGLDLSPGELAESALASYRNSLVDSSPAWAPPPYLVRDFRFCTMCGHPDRDAVEGDFVR